MNITREVVDQTDERNIAVSAIVSTPFLTEIRPILRDMNILTEVHIRMIVKWCFEYYDKYKIAPGNTIHDIFVSERKNIHDENFHESINMILNSLNEKYVSSPDTYNSAYYTAKAKDYIEERSLLLLAETIKGCVVSGRRDEAKRALTGFNKVDKVISLGKKPLDDKEFIEEMFASMKNGILKFPYPHLQELFHDVYRGDVVAVAGSAKKGKSFLMMELAKFSLYSKLNVALFSFEMDYPVMGVRFYQNLLGETRRATDKEILLPSFDEMGNVVHTKVMKDGLDEAKVKDYQKKVRKYMKMGNLYFFDHSDCGRKVSDICDALDRIERFDDCKIDVVVVDYDSLLEPENNKASTYDGINQIWKDVKAKIAQDRNALVIFGSQYGKLGVTEDTGPEHASHSSRKFDYVSHWISLYQNQEEKKAGLMRLSVQGRHDEFHAGNHLVILQCLALARPIVDARWKEQIPNYAQYEQKSQEEKTNTEKKKHAQEEPDVEHEETKKQIRSRVNGKERNVGW